MTGSKRSWPLRSGESGPAAASPLRARLHIQRQIRRTPDDRSFTFRRAPRSARTGKHLRPRLCGRGSRICAHAWLSDNLRIYDDLVPHLVNASWRVVTFDFLGFGQSDKPPGASYSFRQQLGDLKAVVDDLGLGKIVPVAHDSSGMATLNYALTRPDDVDSVIMLNSAYSEDSTVLWPEMITLFATQSMQPLAHSDRAEPRTVWLAAQLAAEAIPGFLARRAEVPFQYVHRSADQRELCRSARRRSRLRAVGGAILR